MKDVILVILALIVLVVVIHQVWIRVAMRNWPIIEGKVVKGEVTFDRAAGGRLRYFPSVCVEYNYQGNKKSSSSPFFVNDGYKTRDEAQRIVDELLAKRIVKLRINPKSVKQVYLV